MEAIADDPDPRCRGSSRDLLRRPRLPHAAVVTLGPRMVPYPSSTSAPWGHLCFDPIVWISCRAAHPGGIHRHSWWGAACLGGIHPSRRGASTPAGFVAAFLSGIHPSRRGAFATTGFIAVHGGELPASARSTPPGGEPSSRRDSPRRRWSATSAPVISFCTSFAVTDRDG